MAVHRMPATASPDARPSARNANEKIRTTMTAKNSMVETISRVRHSTTRSFHKTSQTSSKKSRVDRRTSQINLSMSRVDLVEAGKGRLTRLVGDHLAAAQHHHVVGQVS